ncbi:hypothetical protein [Telmatospirillum siberiense]|uniref:Sulfotransferase domain-containing protein n=1 Tax=Telmatospirillum siberiense TaxID=382514 RepID=A0A2N3PXM3_9PROT|nr:hypothetical protein [Telmatospirillum siberiense]PKU25164.1 hypothetical protein CWS72_08190 [Telmatospirillum siberiense]
MSVEQVVLDKKLIFTVTAGRTGTSYLTKLLEAVPTVSAHHEPKPNYVDVLRRVQSNPYMAYDFLFKQKIPAIRECPGEVYAETSHLICKGFIEPMIRMGLRPALIILRRPPREVAWSYILRDCVPAWSTLGIAYLLDPRDPGVMPLLRWETASAYQLCFWYALEMERRQRHYAKLAEDLGLPVFDVTNRELNDWLIFSEMLDTLDLPITDKIRRAHAAISKKHHNQNPKQMDLPIDDSLATQEEDIWDAVSHYEPFLRDHVTHRYATLSQAA